ncbi:hypothetical protein DSBG_2387 [Desulfosporosinus sp. BG]|nr:hypothetical protein DSBG_2387 [Desulfosporosinus sp. BG]
MRHLPIYLDRVQSSVSPGYLPLTAKFFKDKLRSQKSNTFQ